jgi:hypothetical protein
MSFEALIYFLAAVGAVALAYYFGGKKYAAGAGVAALALLYFVFGKQNDWTDAWKKADDDLKKESEKKKEEKEKAKEEKEQIDDSIDDSKEREEQIRDDLDEVDVENPNDSPEDLKDWVEGFIYGKN